MKDEMDDKTSGCERALFPSQHSSIITLVAGHHCQQIHAVATTLE
jgi:hypothetical protein